MTGRIAGLRPLRSLAIVSSREPRVRELPDGSLATPDGRVFRRTPTRLKRRNAEALINGGAPVVTWVYPDGLMLHSGTAASDAWRSIKPRLVEGKPPTVKDLQWTGHLWQSDEGAPLLYFSGEH